MTDKDAEQAAIEYCGGNKKADARVRTAFVEGARWKEEQLEEERLKYCRSTSEQQYEMEMDFCNDYIKKHGRIPMFLDAIEYGISWQKEQMMKQEVKELIKAIKEN